MNKHFTAFFMLIILVLLLPGCESSPPEISLVEWQINVVNDLEQDQIYEKMTLYIQAQDEDGEDDFDKLYLLNDENELYWEIDADSWVVHEEKGLKWYGYSDFVMNDLTAFPRGKYRVMVSDISGEKAEKELVVNIDSLNFDKLKFPELTLKDDKFYVDTEYMDVKTMIYDNNMRYTTGNVIEYVVTPFREFPDYIKLYEGKKNLLYLYVVADGGYGLITGPYKDLLTR